MSARPCIRGVDPLCTGSHARSTSGCDTLLPETGRRRQPAMALYESCRLTGAWLGACAGDQTCVCYGKRLAAPRG